MYSCASASVVTLSWFQGPKPLAPFFWSVTSPMRFLTSRGPPMPLTLGSTQNTKSDVPSIFQCPVPSWSTTFTVCPTSAAIAFSANGVASPRNWLATRASDMTAAFTLCLTLSRPCKACLLASVAPAPAAATWFTYREFLSTSRGKCRCSRTGRPRQKKGGGAGFDRRRRRLPSP